MGTRILTGVIGIPIVIAIVVLGNPLLLLVVLAASCIGVHEIYHAFENKYKPIKELGYGAVILYFALFSWINHYFYIYCALLIIVALSTMVLKYPKYSIVDVSLTLLPVFYVGLLFSFFVAIRGMQEGGFWIWLVAIAAWGCDTCAYFTGMTMGKHKLAPKLSPKKTIEGSIGGIIGAGILAAIYTIVYTQFAYAHLNKYMLIIVAATMLAAAVSQLGDLAASAIKRYFKEKDFGKLLPGHGGILDRCDSILFVAPIIYVAVMIAQNVIE